MDLNFNLHPGQLDIFKSPAKYKVCAAGRRFGKSYLSAVTLLIEGLKTENEYGQSLAFKEVWYVAPTFQQAKDIMWALIKDLGKDIISKTIENTGTIYLVNGRKIQLKGSDRPDTLRGSGLSYVVLDEYAFMKPLVWDEIIMPTLTEVRGGALFIGTPAGKNHFYEIYKYAETDDVWEAWHFNSTDNPILPKDLIEAAKNRLSTHSFKQEFEASFEATGSGIFKDEWLRYSSEEPRGGTYYIAVDPAGFQDEAALTKGNSRHLDETAIAVVKVGPYGWWVKNIDTGRWGIRETSTRILQHYRSTGAACVGIEKGSLKNAIMPYLKDQSFRLGVYPRIEDVTHGNQKKTERIAWALGGRFEHGRIVLNQDHWNDKFRDQLLDFPNPLTHDDMPDALAYIDQLAITVYQDEFEIDYWEPLDTVIGY